MPLRRFRAAAAVMWVGGIAGMIVASVNGNNNGWVATSGIVAAAASVVLIAVSSATSRERVDVFDEADAERFEERVQQLVAAGAAEADVRSLVRDAMRIGRSR